MDDRAADALYQCYREPPVDAEAVDWASEQLLAGADLEGVAGQLAGQGWPDADAIVEAARVSTRRARGIVTRDEVVGDLDFRYRRSNGGMSTFYRACGGPVGFFAFLTGLRSALAAVVRLRRLAATNRCSGRASPDHDG